MHHFLYHTDFTFVWALSSLCPFSYWLHGQLDLYSPSTRHWTLVPKLSPHIILLVGVSTYWSVHVYRPTPVIIQLCHRFKSQRDWCIQYPIWILLAFANISNFNDTNACAPIALKHRLLLWQEPLGPFSLSRSVGAYIPTSGTRPTRTNQCHWCISSLCHFYNSSILFLLCLVSKHKMSGNHHTNNCVKFKHNQNWV